MQNWMSASPQHLVDKDGWGQNIVALSGRCSYQQWTYTFWWRRCTNTANLKGKNGPPNLYVHFITIRRFYQIMSTAVVSTPLTGRIVASLHRLKTVLHDGSWWTRKVKHARHEHVVLEFRRLWSLTVVGWPLWLMKVSDIVKYSLWTVDFAHLIETT